MNLLTTIFTSFIQFFGDGGKEFLTLNFEDGPRNILMTYTVCFAIGVLLAILLAFKEARRLGVSTSHVKNGILIGVPVAIVAARLVYVMFNYSTVTEGLLGFWHKFTASIDFQDGGLVMTGALASAVILIVIFSKRNKINALKILDIVAPAILVTQIFSRFGNFFNKITYGSATTESALSSFLPDFIVQGMKIEGVYYNPIFLYEAAWLFLGLVVILVLRRMKTRLQIGAFFGIYLVWYGIGSLLICELFRNDPLMLGSFPVSLVLSILITLGGIAYILVKHICFKQKTYFNACNEIREKSLQCYVFDLDQTIISAEKLINTAYAETLSKSHKLSIYDDPRLALDGDKLKKYIQFTKENHEVLTKTYPGVNYTLSQIMKTNSEIIIISKLPASLIALKLHHFGLSKYINRFINSNDIAKLGKQYNPFAIMVFSSDKKLLNFASRNGFKTAYTRYANNDTTGVVSDEILNKLADAEYLV